MSDLPRHAARVVAPAMALVLGLLVALHPLFLSGFRETPGSLDDTRLVHFSIEHAHRSTIGGEGRSFWDPPLFHPARNVAAYTDTMLTLVPFYSPWRLLGATPDTAFQVWLIVVWTLNFVAFHLYLRRFFALSPVAASAGAYLFAFGSSRLANTSHPQLIPSFFLVVALAAAHAALTMDESDPGQRYRRRIYIGVFSLALVLQLWSAFYPLFFFVIFCLLAILAGLVERRGRVRLLGLLRREWPTLALAGAAAVMAAMPILQRYLTVRGESSREWAQLGAWLPHWHSWLSMGHTNLVFGSLQRAFADEAFWRSSTHSNGIGVVTLLCAALGLWRGRSLLPVRLFIAVAAAVVLLTTLWPGGLTLWRLVFDVLPGADAIRAVGRIGLFLSIPAGVGLALFVERALARERIAMLAALSVLIVVEQSHRVNHFDKYEA